MKRQQICVGVLLVFLTVLLTGCSSDHMTAEAANTALPIKNSETEDVMAERRQRTGTLNGDKQNLLTEPQKTLLLAYMERYYETLAELKMAVIEDLFSPQATEQLALNQSTWEYEIGLRTVQKTDLRLQKYYFQMAVNEVQHNKDGSVMVSLTEHSVQNFAQHPEVYTEFFDRPHMFVLESTSGEWKIRKHQQKDGIYQNILGMYEETDIDNISEAGSYFAAQKEALLNLAEEQRTSRDRPEHLKRLPAAQYTYDRAKAVLYADTWVGKRNRVWYDFTGRGGNCQNFVSQCLRAGGVPMDTGGEHVWKWYSEDLNDGNMAYGNSTSWINVEAFNQYASDNVGTGLVAVADAPYYSGEVGDVIRLGFPGNWSHTVIISKVIRNEQGEIIDYLVHSNTADLKYFPVSAYSIPCQSLIKIVGWN